jgi:hypothetical protein
MRKWHALAAIALAVTQVALVACSAILGLEPPGEEGGVATGDASTFQTIPCVFLDAQVPDATATTWFPFNSSMDDAGAGLFAFFDLATLGTPIGNANLGFAGGTFDGTNIYLVASTPLEGGLMLQHPVGAAFGGSWKAFDFGTLGIPKKPYQGAAFDGRYVYYASRGEMPSPALRYDTKADASFSTTSAWAAFDIDGVTDDAGGKAPLGFSGAVFDGRYVYFVPYNNGTIARYDTKPPPPASDGGAPDAGDAGDAAPPSAFDTEAHWSIFDTSTVDNRSTGFQGAVFDGRFIYLIPYAAVVFERYDTTNKGSLGNPGAWSSYEIDTLPFAPKTFAGAVFDGHYIYLVPHAGRVTLRYDSSKGLSASSFTEFDLSTVVPAIDGGTLSFNGGAFDGRFVYYMPGYNNGGEVLRYDTLSPFTAPCSWSAFDLAQQNAQLGTFFGGVFDGHYVYFAPTRSMVVRYEPKSTISSPALPQWSGSFF